MKVFLSKKMHKTPEKILKSGVVPCIMNNMFWRYMKRRYFS